MRCVSYKGKDTICLRQNLTLKPLIKLFRLYALKMYKKDENDNNSL